MADVDAPGDVFAGNDFSNHLSGADGNFPGDPTFEPRPPPEELAAARTSAAMSAFETMGMAALGFGMDFAYQKSMDHTD